MLLLDGWDQQDFIPRAEFQKHKDVIIPLAVKLAARTETTVLVKVKSHMGVPLNEAADVEANNGLLSCDLRPAQSPTHQWLLTPMDSNCSILSDFNSSVRKACAQSHLDVLRSGGGMTTESYCWEGRGQQYLHSAKQSLLAKLQRSMLQLLGWTPSHILCSCKPLQDIVTALHDKIWKCLFEFLAVSLPDWKLYFDKAIGKFDLLELTRPFTCSVSKKKPDGAAQRTSQNECFLLEFMRTTDFWPTSLDTSRARKEDKEG
eukprot:3598063-Rhodomonas_salina.3